MAKDEKGLGLGEISTIRDILMGQQMAEYHDKFDAIAKREEEMEKALIDRINQLEKDINNRINALEKDVNNRFDKLEKTLNDKVEMLENKINDTSRSDKHELGNLLKGISETLLKA